MPHNTTAPAAAPHQDSDRVTVFLAEPITERLVTDPRDDDTPEEVAARQAFLDAIAGP
jgi:hypothetical protein